MKHKTSMTISDEVLKEMDGMSHRFKSRSEFAETAIRQLLKQLEREEREKRDAEIINRNADRLNRESEDVLGYQVLF